MKLKFLFLVGMLFGLCSCGITDVADIEGQVDRFLEGKNTRAEITVINTQLSNLNYVWTGRIDAGGGSILANSNGLIQIKAHEDGEAIDIIFYWVDGGFTTVPVYVKPGQQFTITVAPDPIFVTQLH